MWWKPREGEQERRRRGWGGERGGKDGRGERERARESRTNNKQRSHPSGQIAGRIILAADDVIVLSDCLHKVQMVDTVAARTGK